MKERVAPAILIRNQANNSPAYLQRISFEEIGSDDDKGKPRSFKTKRDALIKETVELFNVRNVKDLVVGANQAKKHMEHVGLFTSVGVIIDVDKKSSRSDGYELKFLVKEARYPKGRIGVDVSTNGEAVSTLRGNYLNALGRGENVSVQKVFGYRHSSLFNLGFTKPLLGWQRYSGINSQLYRSYEEASWGKYFNLETGITAGFQYKPKPNITHQLRWIGAWRNVSCLSNDASFDIRSHSGHSLKSSVQSDLEYSTLNQPFIPEKGLSLRLLQELAGLGGDVKYFRNSMEFKSSTKLFQGLILSTSFHAAYIHPMSGPTLPVADRIFLGGPANLRGFQLNSVGPESDGCFLGGMSNWCAGIHLYRHLYPRNIFFAHVFGVVGNIHGVEAGSSLEDVLRRLAVNPRASIGAGLAVRMFGICQLEFNYCIPMQARASDTQQQGFQFGAGVNFV